MFKRLLKSAALLLCAVAVLLCAVSCAKEPYPYDLNEYITVPDDFSDITVEDMEIYAYVKQNVANVIANNSKLTPVIDRGARAGDIATFSFTCYYLDDFASGKTAQNSIAALNDNNCILKIGEGKYPAELENAIIGLSSGATFKVQATLPEKFTVDGLAGAQIVYVCHLESLQESVPPVYDDAFVNENFGYETVKDYEDALKISAREELIFEKLLEKCVFEAHPSEEVGEYAGNFISHYTELAYAEELTLEEYVGKKFFITLNEFNAQADEYARDAVEKELLVYYLVRTYALDITNEEYNEGALKYAVQYGFEGDVSALESKFGKDFVRYSVQMDKVLKYLSEQVVSHEQSEGEVPTE